MGASGRQLCLCFTGATVVKVKKWWTIQSFYKRRSPDDLNVALEKCDEFLHQASEEEWNLQTWRWAPFSVEVLIVAGDCDCQII